jgi:hypothetical protein
MNRIIIISAITTIALAVACAGGAASEPPSGKSDTPSTPMFRPADTSANTEAVATAIETPTAAQTPTATQKADTGQPITKKEVATFIEGYLKVFFDGDVDGLPEYLSSTCSQKDKDALVSQVALTGSILSSAMPEDFKFSVIVDPEKLAVDIVSDDRVVIAAQQPEGTIILRADDQSLPDLELGQDADEPLVLVREQGRLVTTDCVWGSG